MSLLKISKGSPLLGIGGMVMAFVLFFPILICFLLGFYGPGVILLIICLLSAVVGMKNLQEVITRDETNEGVEPLETYTY
jgi:hypothetical protein